MAQDKKTKTQTENKDENFPGYPPYPRQEDVYAHAKKEADLDPEFPDKQKTPTDDPDQPNEKNFSDDVSGTDLDVPGSELDDAQEDIGSEDEENNFYSLGGDKE